MLVKMPREKRAEQDFASQNADVGQQAAKTRPSVVSDLPFVFVYDTVVGGAGKRLMDILVALLTAPIWTLALLTTAALKWRTIPRHLVLSAHQRVGYGGKPFKCWRMNVTLPSAEILPLPGCAASPSLAPEASWRFTWIDLIERLPEMWNVLAGDMSLTGPRPLTGEAFDDLGWSRKYYASARPGFISANDFGETHDSPTLSYKYYMMDWSFALDMRTLRCAAKQLAHGARNTAPGVGAALNAWR